MRKFLLAGSAACVILANPAIAQSTAEPAPAAQDDKDGRLTDIVVTAQRRNETAQTVPIAISAFSGDQLAKQGVSSTLDLGQFVPNMIAQSNTGLASANAFYIRGLGNSESIPTFDPPVGTYIDDIYLSRQNANNLNLFDVERVEVMRGPQGTLFGRNTTGGAINVILRQPEFDKFGGYAEVGYGSYNKKLLRASVDVPLAPTFAVKLSGYWQDDDGYAINSTTGQRTNDDDGWGLRLGLRGELSPDVRWNASYAYIEANGEGQVNYDCDPRNPSNCNGRFVTTGLQRGRVLDTSPYLPVPVTGRKAFYGLSNNTQSHIVTSNLTIDVADKTSLSLITGYVAQAQQYAMDFSDGRGLPSLSSPVPPVQGYKRGGFTILTDGQATQFSQEIKLNGSLADGLIDYVTGFYYLTELNRTDFADLLSTSQTNTLLLADRMLRNTTDAYAGYMQADVNLGIFTATAGIRYTDETKTFSVHDNRAICNTGGALPVTCLVDQNLIAPSGVRIPLRQQVKLWTPRFALNIKPADNTLLFLSATKGFKSGGWNARGTATNTFLPFDPEQVWSYEAGVKADLFDRTLRTNITLYQEEVTNLQTPSGLVNPVTGAITFLTRNFADYRNRGVEVELTLAPARGLTLYVNGGYQDDKYVIDPNAPAVDIYGIQSGAAQQALCKAQLATGAVPASPATPACGAGIITARGEIATPVRTPDFTVAMGATYRMPLSNGMSLVPSLNASWHSEQEVQTSNLSFYSTPSTGTNGTFPSNALGNGSILQGSFSNAVWLANASLTLNGIDDRWSLSAGCTNCFDAIFTQSSLANATYFNPPRKWTLRAKYKF